MVRNKSRTSRVQKRARTSRVKRRSRVSRGQKRSKISRVSRVQKRSKISRVSRVQKRSKISRGQKRARTSRVSRSQKRARNKTLQKRLNKIRNNFRGGMEDAAGEVEFYFDSQDRVNKMLDEKRKEREGESLEYSIASVGLPPLEKEEEERSPPASEPTDPPAPTDTPAESPSEPAVSPSGVDVSMRGPSMTGWDALLELARAKKPMGKEGFGQFLYTQLERWIKNNAPWMIDYYPDTAGGIQLRSLQQGSTSETYETPENYGKLYEHFYSFLRKPTRGGPQISQESLENIEPRERWMAEGSITSAERDTPAKWVPNEWSFFSNHFLDRMFSESVRSAYFSQKKKKPEPKPGQSEDL